MFPAGTKDNNSKCFNWSYILENNSEHNLKYFEHIRNQLNMEKGVNRFDFLKIHKRITKTHLFPLQYNLIIRYIIAGNWSPTSLFMGQWAREPWNFQQRCSVDLLMDCCIRYSMDSVTVKYLLKVLVISSTSFNLIDIGLLRVW